MYFFFLAVYIDKGKVFDPLSAKKWLAVFYDIMGLALRNLSGVVKETGFLDGFAPIVFFSIMEGDIYDFLHG